MSPRTALSAPGGDTEIPDYTVRVSARARRVRLQVNLHGRVEVVIPRGFDPREVPAFVAGHAAWLRRALHRVAQYRAAHPDGDGALPQQIALDALDANWAVHYDSAPRPRCGVRQLAPGTLQVSGQDTAARRAALHRWLHHTARLRLVPWLSRVSAELDLPFRGATIRCQKTRWGSCSCRGQINLNRNLLFLPPRLVEYLFVHELCHLVHLNHSPEYWRLVARTEPDYRRLEKELRGASRLVPLWAYPE